MTRVRAGSPKPTDGTADLPFQSKGRGKSRPHETWTLLCVKLWRLRQKVAVRLRRTVGNWQGVLAIREKALQLYPNKEKSQVQSLASSTVYGHLQLRQRFVRGSYPDEAVISRGDIVGDRALTLRSTIGRRAMYATRTVVVNFARRLRATTLGIVGQQCLLCGSLYHSVFGCLSDFERTFFLEADHIESAITRMRDVSIREEDWSDDFIRIGCARLAQRKAQDARLIGMLFWFGALARHTARLGGAGVVLTLLRYPVLANELWRVLCGTAVLPEPPRTRLLLHRIWGSEGLYDFAYRELRLRQLATQYPGTETSEQAPTQGVLVISGSTARSQNDSEDTVDTIARGMVLSRLLDAQLEFTDYLNAMNRLSYWESPASNSVGVGLNSQYLRESGVPALSWDDRKALVCGQCLYRAWKGSTCPACLQLRNSVRSLDKDLWSSRPRYRTQPRLDLGIEDRRETARRVREVVMAYRELEDMMVSLETSA